MREDKTDKEGIGSADPGEPIQKLTKSRKIIEEAAEAAQTGKQPVQKTGDEFLEEEFERAYGKTDGSPEAKRRLIDEQVDKLCDDPEVAAQMKRATYARYGIPEY